MATMKQKKALATRRKSLMVKPTVKATPKPKPKAKAKPKPKPKAKPLIKKDDEDVAVIAPGAFGNGRKKKKARA